MNNIEENESSELLLNDNIKLKIPSRPKLVTVLWIIACIVIGCIWYPFFFNGRTDFISLGDIGAFLSGVFSFLAFYWFIEAYLLQSQELRLQRFDLKKSIEAQKGSEQALKAQSRALEAQLEITRKQFEFYTKSIELKRPKFSINENEYQVYTHTLSLIVINIGGECHLSKVTQYGENNINLQISTEPFYDEKSDLLQAVLEGNGKKEYFINPKKFNLNIHSNDEGNETLKEISIIDLSFYYSYAGISGESVYRLNITDSNILNEKKLSLEFIKDIY